MTIHWIRQLFASKKTTRLSAARAGRRPRVRPVLEALEDRAMPSTTVGPEAPLTEVTLEQSSSSSDAPWTTMDSGASAPSSDSGGGDGAVPPSEGGTDGGGDSNAPPADGGDQGGTGGAPEGSTPTESTNPPKPPAEGDENRAPTALSLAPASVAEHSPAGTVVGMFSTEDPNAGDVFTYSLVKDPKQLASPAFMIVGDKLQTTASLDFETESSYSILVRSTDLGGMFIEQSFTISVDDVVESVRLSDATVAENLPPGAEVGSLGVTGVDSRISFKYSLVKDASDSDNDQFKIDANGVLTTAATFDFEKDQHRTIRVRATALGLPVIENTIEIQITNVNESPTGISPHFSVHENQPEGTLVGYLETQDPDIDDTFTYRTMPLGEDVPTYMNGSGFFTIVGNQLFTRRSFDFELLGPNHPYLIAFRSTDAGGLSFEKRFSFLPRDVNEAPEDITLSSNTLPENQPVDTIVGTFTTKDPDLWERRPGHHTYELASGQGDADNARFAIAGDQLVTAVPLDFEAQSSYSIRVRTTDTGFGDPAAALSYEKVFSITLTDVNEAPTDIILDGGNIEEDKPAWSTVGRLSSVDQDAFDGHGYVLVNGEGGEDNEAFILDPHGHLVAAAPFDFETKSTYNIRVRSTDAGGLAIEKAFTVNIINVNEAPTLSVPSSQRAYEDVTHPLTGISVNDADGDVLTILVAVTHGSLSLDATTDVKIVGNGSASVMLSGKAGDLNAALAGLRYRGSLNYSGADTLSVRVSDGYLKASRTVAIEVISAAQQAADLQAYIDRLRISGDIEIGQANSLQSKLSLKLNHGDTGKVQAFLKQVAALRKSGGLSKADADFLSELGNLLLLSVSVR